MSMSEINNYKIRKDKSFVTIEFSEEQKCLSSAIFNGGNKKITSALILKVEENFKGEKKDFERPEITIKKLSDEIGIKGEFLGMMTSASMNSFREIRLQKENVVVSAMLTSGVANAKRAGEKAEWQSFEQITYKSGTINIVLYTNLNLSNSALTEAVMIITEAKAAALQNLNIKTPDNNLATGTGTDSVAVVCNTKGIENNFCGKHTLLGEMIGKAVYQALISSQNL